MTGCGRLTVLGDVSIELSASIADFHFQDMLIDRLVYTAIDPTVGGSALNLAISAVAHFSEVSLIGAVGLDPFGDRVRAALALAQVRFCAMTGVRSTSLAIYLREGGNSATDGRRLLLIDPGANAEVDIAHVESNRPLIATSDAVVVDGYCMLSEPRRSAANHCLAIGKASGAFTVFDLVPHDAERYFSARDVAAWLTNVHLLIAEVRTIRRVMGLSATDVGSDLAAATSTWVMLGQNWPELQAILRFGTGNIEETIHCQPGTPPIYARTGYVQTKQPRGFGDRLTAAEVAEHVRSRGHQQT